MNIKEWRKLLNLSLLEQLDDSFKLEKSKERLVRKPDSGSHAIYIALWNYSPDFVFSLTPAITIDSLENLFRDVFGITSKDTHTVMTQLWRFDSLSKPQKYLPLPNSGSPHFWTFNSENSLKESIKRCRSYVEKSLFLFEKISNVADAHIAINLEKWDTTSNFRSHGLVAAFLAKGDWAELGKRYQAELSDWPQADQDAYAKAIERLREHGR